MSRKRGIQSQWCFSDVIFTLGAMLILFGVLAAPLHSARAGGPKRMPGPHVLKRPPFKQDRSVFGLTDRGIGLLDKGQLQNVISNYGILSNFHLSAPAMHWPKDGDDVQQYGFGVDLIVLADGVVIHSIYDQSSVAQEFGWEAADGSNGGLFNINRTEQNTAADEVTPILASSDLPATWPVVDGQPTWPGWFREDLGNPGMQVPGAFTSDRDIYAVFSDVKGVGLRVEQTAYSYDRWYAENYIIIRFRIHNDGDRDLDEVYAGFQADLKPDFYADDRIGAWASPSYDNGNPSFIYKWDTDGVPERDDGSVFDQWVGPVGAVGIGLLESPGNAGITSFHYYHDDDSPVDDEVFSALLRSDPTGIEDPSRYFHGADSTFDDVALWEDVDHVPTTDGAEITFTIATGPFSLARGDSTDLAIVLAIEPDTTALKSLLDADSKKAYFMAHETAYMGSGPPDSPRLTAYPGDGMVRLYWDDRAENSIDPITGRKDFQGYRLYKSLDQGKTWGEPVTNWWGDPVGFVPIFQCDLVDTIYGLDPAYGPDFPSAHLWLGDVGDSTGIKHSFVDTDVTNGIEAWYSITAYDAWVYDPEHPTFIDQSYESSLGTTVSERNVVAVTPGTAAQNLIVPEPEVDLFEVNGLRADGYLEVDIVDDMELTGHTYRITFYDSSYSEPGDTTVLHDLYMNLFDVDRNSFSFLNALTGEGFDYLKMPLNDEDPPVVDGFRVLARNIESSGLDTMYWAVVNGDTCTFDWWTEDRHPDNVMTHDEFVEGLNDWRITITEDSTAVPAFAFGFGDPTGDSTLYVHLKVETAVYELGGQWVDVTDHLWVSDLVLSGQPTGLMGPYGWDLIPGGNAWNPNVFPNSTDALFPDGLLLRDDEDDSTGSAIYLKTQNGPDSAVAPSVGDVFLMETYKPFTPDLTYEFSTRKPVAAEHGDLGRIKVVPNPFILKSGLERNQYESRLMFTHLPQKCTITIYTVDGRRVRTLRYESSAGEGFAFWDLLNSEGQDVAYGVYIYVVKTPEGDSVSGKLMVIR